MTVYSDNAAGRLHNLISGFCRDAYRASNIGQHSIWFGWAAALGTRLQLPPHSESSRHKTRGATGDAGRPARTVDFTRNTEFLRRLAMVFELPNEIAAEISKIDPELYESDLANRWQAHIQPSLSPALFSYQNAAELAQQFDEASLASLEYCSSVLHRHRPQPVPTNEELERITGLVVDLEAEVEGDQQIDPELRDFLRVHSAAMSEALRDLTVRGRKALEDAFDRAVGAVQRRSDLTARIDSRSRSVWKKFGKVIIAVAAALQIATSSLTLPGQVRQELGGPHPTPPAVVKVEVEYPAQPGAGESWRSGFANDRTVPGKGRPSRFLQGRRKRQ